MLSVALDNQTETVTTTNVSNAVTTILTAATIPTTGMTNAKTHDHATSILNLLVSPSTPSEIILHILQHLPFSNGALTQTLRTSHPRLGSLISTYEISLTSHYLLREARHARVDFPATSCLDAESRGLSWLGECVRKYDIVDAIMAEMMRAHEGCGGIREWNVAAVYAGLLLLYRIHTISSFFDRYHFLTHLPLLPLMALYLLLHHSTLTARYHTPGAISQCTYGRSMTLEQLSLRTEMEFCFAEAALMAGPEFLWDMLVGHRSGEGERVLLNVYLDRGTHEWDEACLPVCPCCGAAPSPAQPAKPRRNAPPAVHGPLRAEAELGPSLWTGVLGRLAELQGCSMGAVRGLVEAEVERKGHELAWLGGRAKGRIVLGLGLDGIKK